MSNQRAIGQKLISVPMKEKFIEEIDKALEKIGYSDRSSFIRDAVAEKLRAAGVYFADRIAVGAQPYWQGWPSEPRRTNCRRRSSFGESSQTAA